MTKKDNRNVVGYLAYVDPYTGEVSDNNYIVMREGDQVKCQQPNDIDKLKDSEYTENIKKCKNMSKKVGEFYFMVCYNNKLFDGKVSDKNVAKIIYLATFIDYENNKLVYAGRGRTKRAFEKKDIRQELGIKQHKAFEDFVQEMVDNGIMEFKQDGIYLSTDWFYKGELRNDVVKQINQLGTFSRMYVNTIRQLYKQVKTTQHKSLGYLFRLMPFIDWEYNVISKEPNTGLNAVQKALTKKDIAELLGIEFETFKKAEKALMGLTINIQGQQYYAMGKIIVGRGESQTTRYVINPFIFTGGHEVDKLQQTWTGLLVKN